MEMKTVFITSTKEEDISKEKGISFETVSSVAVRILAAAENLQINFQVVLPQIDVPSLDQCSGIEQLVKVLVPQTILLGSSETEKKEVWKGVAFVKELLATFQTKENKHIAKLHKLNKELAPDVFYLGTQLSLVDLLLYPVLYTIMGDLSDSQRELFSNVTRYFDYLQHLEVIRTSVQWNVIPIILNRNDIPQIQQPESKNIFDDSTITQNKTHKAQIVDKNIQLEANIDATKDSKIQNNTKQEQDKKEQGKDNISKQAQREIPQSKQEQNNKDKDKTAKQDQRENQQGKQKSNNTTSTEKVDVSRLDIRVGKIVTCKKHESADRLYIEEIDVGETTMRQVVSGLVEFIPLDQMQGAEVVVLCNLKPATLAGVKSHAMVLAASNADHTRVELVTPPSGTPVGEHIKFDGYSGTPDDVLNPKKKIFEQVQPLFKTTEQLVATYNGVPFSTSKGVCKVKSIVNGSIK